MKAQDVDIIITNSYRVLWTFRAVEALRRLYPDNRIIVVDDKCIPCDWQLDFIAERHGVDVVRMPERKGAGRAIDAGMREATSKWVLTHDHGVTLTEREPRLIKRLLEQVTPGVAAVGKKLQNFRGEEYLGPAVYCDLAIWDRKVIIENDLSFKLTTLFFPDGGSFWGCTTARYLCWQLGQLGREMRFVDLAAYHTHEHARGKHSKEFGSPHEDVDFDPGVAT